MYNYLLFPSRVDRCQYFITNLFQNFFPHKHYIFSKITHNFDLGVNAMIPFLKNKETKHTQIILYVSFSVFVNMSV